MLYIVEYSLAQITKNKIVAQHRWTPNTCLSDINQIEEDKLLYDATYVTYLPAIGKLMKT